MNDIQEIMNNLEMIEKRKKRKKTMKDIFIGVKVNKTTKPKKIKNRY